MTARIYDSNGWFEIPANPLTRVGVFDYLGRSINAPEPDRIYKVLRPAEELSNPETLNSLRLSPLIVNHVMLGDPTKDANYMPAEQKGVHGVIGDNVYFNPDDGVVYGNLKVFSTTLGKRLNDPKSGTLELSLGYKSIYDFTPGIWNGIAYDAVQRNQRGNHIAGVPDGRMGGDVIVLDSLTATFDEKDLVIVAKNTKWINAMMLRYTTKPGKKNKAGLMGGTSIATMDEDIATAENDAAPTLEDIKDFLNTIGPSLAEITEQVTPADPDENGDDYEDVMDAEGKPVMDAATGKAKRAKKGANSFVKKDDPKDDTKKDDTMDVKLKATMDAAIAAAVAPLQAEIVALKQTSGSKVAITEIAQRDKLAAQLSHHIGTFDCKEMTLREVAKYAIEKLSIPTTDGQEFNSVTAWLHGRSPARPAFTSTMDHGKGNGKTSVDAFLA